MLLCPDSPNYITIYAAADHWNLIHENLFVCDELSSMGTCLRYRDSLEHSMLSSFAKLEDLVYDCSCDKDGMMT